MSGGGMLARYMIQYSETSSDALLMTKQYHSTESTEAVQKVVAHRNRLVATPFLRQLYGEWYERFIAEMENLPAGMKIELGASQGFFKQMAPSIVSTDSIPLPTNDLTFSPLSMPFNADSVSGIFMVDTFCHMTDTHAFLTEAQRVLKPGGKIIMVEPACSLWGRVANRWFCRRSFDRKGAWANALSAAYKRTNSALAWIVFERDRSRFQEQFPDLSILASNIILHSGIFWGAEVVLVTPLFLKVPTPSFAMPTPGFRSALRIGRCS